MRRLRIKPVTFLNHLERSECLLRLIVVIELPRQIADEKQEKAYGCNNPNSALVFEQACCHVERSREISRSNVSRDLIRSFPIRSTWGLPVNVPASPAAPFSTLLRMTVRARNVHCASLTPENCAHRRAIAPSDF